jgi:signal transduction histidine kinase
LTSMASRARALGGTLRVASGNGRPGTVVTASIPVSRAA